MSRGKLKTLFLAVAILSYPAFAWSQEETAPTTFSSPQEDTTMSTRKRPDVYIGGKLVTSRKKTSGRLSVQQLTGLPPSLNTEPIKASIEQRRHIQVYNHNPSDGPFDAPVTIVEMTDLSCLQCYPIQRMVDEIRQSAEFKDKIRIVNIHLPIDQYNASNPAAFYGRLAHQSGVFWEYRALLVALTEINENSFSEKLLEAGVDVRRLRRLIRQNARQFYRELDADTLLSKDMNEQRPPAYYVNGIRVGVTIPYESLKDLIQFEIDQRKKLEHE